MIAIFSGLIAGLIHVLSGPDHLAAVAPLTIQGGQRGWVTGWRWGCGHAAGVIAVGLLSLGLRGLLPLDLLASWAERLVGVVLIGIGIWGLRRAFANRLHSHEHIHDGQRHVHIHVHGRKVAHAHEGAATHQHSHAAFGVGLLHGFAGSSHFLAMLPALAFPTKLLAVTYVSSYGVGTILAMVCFSSAIAILAQIFSFSGTRAYRMLMAGCSGSALLVGSLWLLG